MDFRFLLDAAGPQGEPRTKLQIAKLGDFKDTRYGDFKITGAQVRSWAANLAKMPGGRVPIDLDHGPEKGGSTEAAGWITGIALDDGTPTASVEWTPVGEKAIREKTYLFFSPTYSDNYPDEHGESLGATLIGGALTNRPFLDMPMISLSRAPIHVLESDSREVRDSRPRMDTFTNIAKTLGLAEDADEKIILEAIKTRETDADAAKTELEAAKTAAEEAAKQPVNLDKQAAGEGKVLLSKEDLDDLKAAATAGADAAKTLSAMKFETAYEKGVTELRVAPAQKDELKALYDVAPEHTIKLMESAPKLAAEKRQGETGKTAEVPSGHDPEATKLDTQVRSFMQEHDEANYSTALDKVLTANGSAA